MSMRAHTEINGAGAVSSEPFLAAADAIGCRLVRDAIWHEKRCNWQIWTKEQVSGVFQSVYRAAPAELYLGTAGIALFLAHLVRFTGDTQQRATLAAAVRQIQARLQQRSPISFGFYAGASGAAWSLIAIGEICNEEAWTQSGLKALDEIAGDANTQHQFDLIGGQAGLIIALTSAADHFDAPALLEHATRIAGTLADAAQHEHDTACWPSAAGESRALLGLSHGVAGIALALLELNRLRPDARIRDVALAALRYERRAFDAERRNWPDYRSMPGVAASAPGFPVAWCHGSTGIGIARLRLLELMPDDAQATFEIDVALSNATTALNVPMAPLSTDFTLCHGMTGNSELLLGIADHFQRADALAAAHRVGRVMLDLVHEPRLGWGCGMPDCGDSPSLLTGSAGIGLHFLRLHDRSSVPGILYPKLPPRGREHTLSQRSIAAPSFNTEMQA